MPDIQLTINDLKSRAARLPQDAQAELREDSNRVTAAFVNAVESFVTTFENCERGGFFNELPVAECSFAIAVYEMKEAAKKYGATEKFFVECYRIVAEFVNGTPIKMTANRLRHIEFPVISAVEQADRILEAFVKKWCERLKEVGSVN